MSSRDVSIRINGTAVDPPADPWVSLLDLLRKTLGLHGTKKGCNQGACGACTVLVDSEHTAGPAGGMAGLLYPELAHVLGDHPVGERVPLIFVRNNDAFH